MTSQKQLGLDWFATMLRSHIVMCHTLLPVDLSRPRNLTSLSGHVLTTSYSQVSSQSSRMKETLEHFKSPKTGIPN